MSMWTINDSKWTYRLDFALYGIAVACMALLLALRAPVNLQWLVLMYVCAGVVAWTAIEYFLHRFVLHGLHPFSHWHEAHHAHPNAWICSSTLLSAGLIFLFVFAPAYLLLDLWRALALTLGVVVGYVMYATTHHALHHWRMPLGWLHKRKQWHALHHYCAQDACFGVTSTVWDQICGTTNTKEQ